MSLKAENRTLNSCIPFLLQSSLRGLGEQVHLQRKPWASRHLEFCWASTGKMMGYNHKSAMSLLWVFTAYGLKSIIMARFKKCRESTLASPLRVTGCVLLEMWHLRACAPPQLHCPIDHFLPSHICLSLAFAILPLNFALSMKIEFP